MKYTIMVLCAIIALNAQAQKKQAVPAPKVAVQSDSVPKGKTNPLPNTGQGTVMGNSLVKKKGIDVNPVKVWRNGATLDGVDLDVSVAYEDLENMVRFYYELKDSTGAQIANGNVEVTGEDYDDYKTKPNHAQRAYQIVLRYLRLQAKTSIQN
jgi:hypothetical protein